MVVKKCFDRKKNFGKKWSIAKLSTFEITSRPKYYKYHKNTEFIVRNYYQFRSDQRIDFCSIVLRVLNTFLINMFYNVFKQSAKVYRQKNKSTVEISILCYFRLCEN